MTDLPKEKELTEKETNLVSFAFTLTCPKCQATLTPSDFDNNHFTIAHLQSYFTSKESLYKEQLLAQLTSNPSSFPAYQTLQKENQELKLLLEGYKLGTTKSSKQKGEDLEKYITERLQETYNGQDDISKITHVGTKADISQIIHANGQIIGQIIYEGEKVRRVDEREITELFTEIGEVLY
ncbi:19078_t:CDS:2 [Racocetra fulgida]|uniref:19078_t:CDS:1 n=1 Tax=Racocetra fulgida TaxID=60492 RepID=A0A9N8VZ76_9GLOM|nr:19078_t:CDS:2 [Racocetra fulgida]